MTCLSVHTIEMRISIIFAHSNEMLLLFVSGQPFLSSIDVSGYEFGNILHSSTPKAL